MVLSYATWKHDFAGDASIVGRTVRISQQPFTVLGVARPEFTGTERFMRPAVWVDMWNESQFEGYNYLNTRGNSGIWVMGRRKPGITVAQAQVDLDRIAQQFSHEYPQTDDKISFRLRAARLSRRLPRHTHSQLPGRPHVAGGSCARGCMRESRRPLCRARCGPHPRTRHPCRPRRRPWPRAESIASAIYLARRGWRPSRQPARSRCTTKASRSSGLPLTFLSPSLSIPAWASTYSPS